MSSLPGWSGTLRFLLTKNHPFSSHALYVLGPRCSFNTARDRLGGWSAQGAPGVGIAYRCSISNDFRQMFLLQKNKRHRYQEVFMSKTKNIRSKNDSLSHILCFQDDFFLRPVMDSPRTCLNYGDVSKFNLNHNLNRKNVNTFRRLRYQKYLSITYSSNKYFNSTTTAPVIRDKGVIGIIIRHIL